MLAAGVGVAVEGDEVGLELGETELVCVGAGVVAVDTLFETVSVTFADAVLPFTSLAVTVSTCVPRSVAEGVHENVPVVLARLDAETVE